MRDGRRIIDTDSHQMEPARIWTDYIDPAFRERAPRPEQVGGREILHTVEDCVLTHFGLRFTTHSAVHAPRARWPEAS